MPTVYQSLAVSRFRPGIVGNRQGGLIAVRGIVVPQAALILNDLLEAVILPAQYVPVDAWIDTDDVDSATSMTLDAGVMSGNPGSTLDTRTVTTDFFSASTIGQAGGLARSTRVQGMRITGVDRDRSLGMRVLAAPTGVASIANMLVDRGVWQASTVYAASDFITLPDGRRARCSTGGTSGTTFPPNLPVALYNTTATDGSVTWTVGDAAIALTVLMRPAVAGA